MDLSLRSIRKGVTAFSIFALIASMFVTINVANAAFGDVPSDAWYAADVQWGLDNGILDPTQAYFRGGDNATRAEFSKMVAAAAGIPEAACDETLFPDVGASHWGCGWVTALADAGVVSGDTSGATAGYFRPNDNVLRAEAAKMVVEAFALTAPAGTLGSDYFTDSVVGQWYDEYIGVARYNCVFQGVGGGTTVEPARNIVRAEGVAVAHRADTPTTDCEVGTPVEGALNIAVDASSPEAAYIPKNGANILYTVLALTASADEDIRIEEIIVSRAGLGLAGDFDNVKLYVDGVQVGGEKTMNASTNSATFSITSDPILVPAGTTVLLEVRGDMAGLVTTENSQNQLCVDMADDVLAYGETSNAEVIVGGTFAACGELMTTTSAEVGTLTYKVTQPSSSDINIGDTDVVFTKVQMAMANEDAEVTRLTFKQAGSAEEADFANLNLLVSGTVLADNPTWEGDYVTFDLSGDPLPIAKGNTKTVELWGDVVGGLGNDAGFDIYRDWHIEGTGMVYGYGVNVVEDPASITPANRDIVGGNIAFATSASNPVTGDVAKGARDFEFLRFNISTGGDGVTVRKLNLNVDCADQDGAGAGIAGTDTHIEDLKIWTLNSASEWVVIAGPNDVNVACAGGVGVNLAYTDTFDIPAGTTKEYIVTADITNTAALNEQYSIDLADTTDNTFTELEYSDGTPVDELTEVTGGALTGNVMTVALPAVDVSRAATPGDKTYVRRSTEKDLVAFDFQASTASDIRVTGFTLTCDPQVGGDCAPSFTTLNLFLVEGSTITKIDGPRAMSDLGVNGETVFSLNQVIPAGDSSRFLVRANLTDGAISDSYDFAILTGDVTAEDSESSAATVTLLPNPPGTTTAVRTVTLAANGVIGNQSVTDTDTKSRILTEMSSGETIMKLRFAADGLEAWYLKKLTIEETNNAPISDRDISKVYLEYKDINGATQTAQGTLVNGLLTFNSLNAYIPANGNQTMVVKVDVPAVTAGGAEAGDVFQLEFLNTNTFQLIGASSAADCYDVASCGALGNPVTVTDVTADYMRVAKSAPTFAKVDVSTTLANGELSVYKWTVAADDAGDLGLKQVAFTSENNVTGTVSGFKLFKNGTLVSDSANIEIYDSAWTNWLEPTGGNLPAGTNLVAVYWDNGAAGGEDIIAKGTSATYELKATFSGVVSGDDFSLTPVADTAGAYGTIDWGAAIVAVGGSDSYFTWSDLSASPHDSRLVSNGGSSADWLDGWLVNGLSSAGSQILSKS